MSDTATVEKTMDSEQSALESKHFDVQAELKTIGNSDEEGTFEGYGSIFNNRDLGNDIIESGAFSKSLARKPARAVKMLYQHNASQPIGVFTEILEDDQGLRVKGKLAMGTQMGREVYELMKMGAIDGLSIGYRVSEKGATWDNGGKIRRIKEVDLMEISAVTFPMNPKARVRAVKGEQLTVRDWEEILRDAGALSRNEAKVAASAVTKALTNLRDAEEEKPELVDAIKRLTSILNPTL